MVYETKKVPQVSDEQMHRTELLDVLSEVKTKVQDKVGAVDIPLPQFILIGKQSVGKSRLIEALAGEQFNFVSGTLGSRRPTVLEFRNVVGQEGSMWYVIDPKTHKWNQRPLMEVMHIIGEAHESLGANVTDEPVFVRLESPFVSICKSSIYQDSATSPSIMRNRNLQTRLKLLLCDSCRMRGTSCSVWKKAVMQRTWPR